MKLTLRNKWMVMILMVGAALSSALALAADPVVICGKNDPAGNTELDVIMVYRSGTPYMQLVLRNKNIINDFIEKHAISRDEINDKGEFIVYGTGGNGSFSGTVGSRNFRFGKVEDGYGLYVRDTVFLAHGIDTPMANFIFKDCERP